MFYNIDNSKKEQIGVSIAGLTSYRHKSKKYMVLQIVSRILIGHNYFVYIIHRIDRGIRSLII